MRAEHSSKHQGELKRKGFQGILHPLQLSSGPCTPTQLAHLPFTEGLLCWNLESWYYEGEGWKHWEQGRGWGVSNIMYWIKITDWRVFLMLVPSCCLNLEGQSAMLKERWRSFLIFRPRQASLNTEYVLQPQHYCMPAASWFHIIITFGAVDAHPWAFTAPCHSAPCHICTLVKRTAVTCSCLRPLCTSSGLRAADHARGADRANVHLQSPSSGTGRVHTRLVSFQP